ncbi:MAG TPA: DUF3122 domain-containing protein [Oscillatoriaceae cyanobacterium M33_DOE_052]|uniref:DUF3122 domain-containing protein n=1 Tax=Planktothricoides sp. SpSt-374 TaxID=2282167 RepID=A0A7C3ZLI4_9CYAN|nr:DUF3122 domain-containing protein [Oscillatoriaceae cyanobacterium M33_DOE_052]
MKCGSKKIFALFLLLGALILSLLVVSGMLNIPSAQAAIRQLEEAPGQIVYQSRQTLKDNRGNGWQAIAFQRIRPDGTTSFSLRLVGFPGVGDIDRTQPLTLTNSLGKTLTLPDASANIFTNAAAPEPNVAQYNLQPLLGELQPEIPLKLIIPIKDAPAVSLSVSPSLVQEWQTVASYK